MGDAQVTSHEAMLNFDMQTFYEKVRGPHLRVVSCVRFCLCKKLRCNSVLFP